MVGFFRARRRRIESFLATVGLVVAIGLGALWTAHAVVDGRPWLMLARFTVSASAGAYYLVLLTLSRRSA